MPSANPTIFFIKVTKPVTNVNFGGEQSRFTRVKLIDVKGIESCIVYLSTVWEPWSLSNLDDVYPGDTVVLKKSKVLGIYPSTFENTIEGQGTAVKEMVLKVTKLDGSEPEFHTPIILTIRAVGK